jgi:diguanylate cyclase (GGDEF)-like protein/PAS domain S-box-containing protein
MLNELISKEFQRIILSNTAMWLNMLDKDANVIMWNKAAEKISGYSKEEVLGNSTIWELLYPDEGYRTYIYSEALEIIHQGKELIDFETTILCKNGSNRILSWNTHDIKDENSDVIGSIALARDVTEIHVQVEKLKALTLELEQSNKKLLEFSYVDKLTNIANRRAYDEKIANEIQSAKRSGKELSLLIIDIDNFKEYNDTYGHENGDVALLRVANQISNNLPRKTDFIARYGGDEMVAVLPYTSIENAILVAEKVVECIFTLNIEHSHSKFNKILTVSVGLASTDTGFDKLLLHADQALYRAKKNGRNRFEIHTNN